MTEWIVEVVATFAPIEASKLPELFPEDDIGLTLDNDKVEIQIGVEAEGYAEAYDVGTAKIQTILAANLDAYEIVSARAATAAFEDERAKEAGPIIGRGDIARMLGVSPQRAAQLAESDPNFPPSVDEIGGRKMYRYVDAVVYQARRQQA